MTVALTPTDTDIFYVDREHGSLRLVVLLVFVAAWVIGGLLIAALISSTGFNIIALLGGFAIGYAVSTLAERWLKPRWPTVRQIALQGDRLSLVKRGRLEQQLLAGERVEELRWRFEVRKRTRIPKGWWMLAVGLESDSALIIAYAFFPPDQLEQFSPASSFRILTPKKEAKTEDTSALSLRAAGEERRLRAAEETRWAAGAEMTIEDFTRFLDVLAARFPEWAPLS